MKRSIAHLPAEKQEDLAFIVKTTLKEFPQVEMIILFGSYARGNYVDYDQRIEYGLRTCYMSDFDILLLTEKTILSHKVWPIKDAIAEAYYRMKGLPKRPFVTPIQLIHESIHFMNRQISEGYYFHTDIRKEGIILYDSGKFKLSPIGELGYAKTKALAQEYFDDKFQRANSFLRDAKYAYSCDDFKQSSFYLHQAVENLYRTICSVFTLYSHKTHHLGELYKWVSEESEEPSRAFPRDTEEEKRLFNLLLNAYVQARYNPQFKVTKEDIDILIPKVELLKSITEKISLERLNEYQQKIDEEERE